MRRLPLLSVACAALGLAVPAAASAAELHTPSDATAPARPFARPLQDRIVDTSREVARSSSARARIAQSQTQSFFASDGDGPVRVGLSSEYGPLTKEKVQGTVDFLASRLHGSELRRLTVLILTPSELREACSETALACYVPSRELMIIPGEQTPSGEVPVEYVITHEYGHHVAANRDNEPFNDRTLDSAVAFGPKRWATYEQVCAGALSRPRRYFPGDQGENYVRNPGENWAEAYAQLQYQGRFPWQFDPTLTPDAGAFAAVQADVLQPWTKNVAVRRSGRLTSKRRSKTFPVTTTLDGRVVLSLDNPRGANFDVQILSGGKVVARTRRRSGDDRLTATDCVVRQFEVRVVRRSGSGSFSLRVQTPG